MRKKGDLNILTLFAMISVIILTAVFINVFIAFDTYNRVQQGVDMAARTRAQAIDVPLKEMTGYIETYHGAPSNGYVYQDAQDTTNLSTEPGNPTPLPYTTGAYQSEATLADTAAAAAMVQYIHTVLGNNTDGNPLVPNFTTNNVCFDVEPLPANSGYMNFSCQTSLGKVTQDHVFVQGTNQLTYNIGTDTLTNQPRTEIVENVVFVGVKYNYNTFFLNSLKRFGWENAPTQETSSLAYPQVDTCSYSLNATQCPQGLNNLY